MLPTGFVGLAIVAYGQIAFCNHFNFRGYKSFMQDLASD